MNDYSMSDDLFRQRALEEDGCVITALGSELVKAMNFGGVGQGKSQGANSGR
jgi:hypothetical protein